MAELTNRKTTTSTSSGIIGSSTEQMDKPRPSHSYLPLFLRVLTAGGMGIAFGVAMQKAHVFEPISIRHQMVFSSFIMLKMFLSAVVVGQVGLALLSKLAPHSFLHARNEYKLGVHFKSYINTAIGGATLGAGMTLAGACPGMVSIQVGTMTLNSLWTIFGLILGTYIYAHFHPTIRDRLHHPQEKPAVYLDQVMKKSYFTAALIVAAMMAGVIALVEYLHPWTLDVAKIEGGTFGLSAYAWSPMVAGAVVGSLQIPAVVAIGDTLGSSTCYVAVSANLSPIKYLSKGIKDYFDGYRNGFQSWWQIAYIGSAIAGASIAKNMAVGDHPRVLGVSPLLGVIGGIFMIFGSRMAGGCTSGHGLSGMGLLCIDSFVAVPAMFGGAIATAVAMNVMGVLDSFH